MSQISDTVPVVTKCNTCKAAFPSVELVRDHYRSEWHVLNSKRRASGLAHVTLEEYRRQNPSRKRQPKPAASPTKAVATAAPPPPPPQPMPVPSPQVDLKAASAPPATVVPDSEIPPTSNTPDLVESFTKFAIKLGVESNRLDNVVSLAVANEANVENSDDDAEQADEMEEEEPIVVEPNVSIFDDKEFETVDECVAHMQTNFGFFIPEKEYLVDLPGFLVYLGEKVKIGGICLYCQKQFRPGRPLQNHMQSKSHCKIAYEEGVDLDEFEDFYDFSSSYGEGNGTRGGAGEDGDEELDDDDCLEIADTGELLLADGRRLGHRAFRRYYKQRYTPPDTRVAITAQRREDLVRAAALNVGGFRHLTIVGHVSELKNMSDHEVMNLMVRHHKEMRKMQMIEQRATRKQDYRANRMAFQSVKDKLRSSVNTTAKIRDYHGMLM